MVKRRCLDAAESRLEGDVLRPVRGVVIDARVDERALVAGEPPAVLAQAVVIKARRVRAGAAELDPDGVEPDQVVVDAVAGVRVAAVDRAPVEAEVSRQRHAGRPLEHETGQDDVIRSEPEQFLTRGSAAVDDHVPLGVQIAGL